MSVDHINAITGEDLMGSPDFALNHPLNVPHYTSGGIDGRARDSAPNGSADSIPG